MPFQKTEKPTELDLKNYREGKMDPRFAGLKEDFLKDGQRVRALFRIWDLPQDSLEKDWGWVSAEQGETGTVVHTQENVWPTVQFDDSGCSTCVVPWEVEPVNVEVQRRAYSEFFDGLGYRLRNPPRGTAKVTFSTEDGFSEGFIAGVAVAEGYLKDVETGNAPGISLTDMVKTALLELKY